MSNTTANTKKYKLMVETDLSKNLATQVLIEGVDNKAKLARFNALGIETDVENKNGRFYPYEMMVPVVEAYIRDRMQKGRIRSYGELGHPEGVEINIPLASHVLEELKWDGKNCFCVGRCLDTPNGRIANTILQDGDLALGVSTRGLGALDENTRISRARNADVVGEFNLVAIDIVADPSAPQGWIRGICENRQYIIDDGNYQPLVEAYDRLDEALASLPKKDLNEFLSKNLKKFFKDLGKKRL